MKKLILFFSALMIAALFTACEQDSLISTDLTEEVIAEQSLESPPELSPEFMALINAENSGEIDDRCSFNGSVSASLTQGYPGYYGKFRVTATNNTFPPANQYVTYRIKAWQHLGGFVMEQQGQPVHVNGHYLSWESPIYHNKGSRWVYFLVEARGGSCNDWTYIGNKWVQF